MNEIRIFENAEFGKVRTLVDDDGQVWFVGKDVAKVLGYSNHRDALLRHVDVNDKRDGVVIYDSIGREQKATVINLSGVFALILSSKLEGARKFQHWVTSEVLPSIQRTGSYSVPSKTVEAINAESAEMQKHIMFVNMTADVLRLDENSKLRNLYTVAERFNVQGYLPDYTTPKDVHFSATTLLKKNGIKMSARVFNKKMLELGYLEEKVRPSKSGETSFYSISEKGMSYGINQSSPHNPNETQPHWYEHTFSDLISQFNSNNTIQTSFL